MALLNIIFYSSIFCLTAGAVLPKVGVKKVFYKGNYTSGNEVYNFEEKDLFIDPKEFLGPILDFDGALDWDHDGQGKWGEKYPDCNGDHQSPINIRNEYIQEGGMSCVVFKNYGTTHMFITPENLGTVVEFLGPFGDNKDVQPTMSGGPLVGSYQLAALHFHWGYDNTDGSEHAINSKKFPMEMHLVHFNTDFSSINEALESGRPDALSVIGILFEPSFGSSPEVSTLVNTVEDARLGKLTYPITLPLNIVDRKTNYFTYMGSLTTPKCFESVQWIVYETPLSMKADTFEVFRDFMVNGKPLVDNFRTTQQMNGRDLIRHSC